MVNINGKIIVEQLFENLSDGFYKKEHYRLGKEIGEYGWSQIYDSHNQWKVSWHQINQALGSDDIIC